MRKKITLLLICFSVLSIILSSFLFLQLTQIKKVYIVSAQNIYFDNDIFNHTSSIFINNNSIRDQILLRNPEIKEIEIHKKFPNTLFLTPILRIPYAQILSAGAEYLIDDEGVVLTHDYGKGEQLPLIQLNGFRIHAIRPVDWRIVKALDYLRLSRITNIRIHKITIDQSNQNLSINIEQGTNIIAPLSKNPAELMASLQVIVQRFRIEGKLISKIDFQFDKPTLVLSSGENLPPR